MTWFTARHQQHEHVWHCDLSKRGQLLLVSFFACPSLLFLFLNPSKGKAKKANMPDSIPKSKSQAMEMSVSHLLSDINLKRDLDLDLNLNSIKT
jgi:hypothetical protein